MVLPNPLIIAGDPPPAGVIRIRNAGSSVLQVAVSNVTSPDEPPTFNIIESGQAVDWPRVGRESVYINGGGFGRVAIAIAGPGSYIVQPLEYIDPNVGYVFNTIANSIGIRNNLAVPIQVKVSNNSGGSGEFFPIAPGIVVRWDRNGLETIFVKYEALNGLLTYLGIPGQDLQVNALSFNLAPNISSNGNELGIWNIIGVHNQQAAIINVKVSSATGGIIGPDVEEFYPINAGQILRPGIWTRNGPEVVYVNGPVGTAVGAYYGNPGLALNADAAIS